MKMELQQKVDMLSRNSQEVRSSAKLDSCLTSNLGALLFTAKNQYAVEDVIRANRKLMKSQTGVLSNMRGVAVNLALICRMSMRTDPEVYLKNVMAAYDCLKAKKLLKGEELVFTAMAMVDDTDPSDYEQAARGAWDTLEKMRAAHPLLTNQSDMTLAHLLNKSGIDSATLLDEAEKIYNALKDKGFKLNKDTLQSISIILALSDKPLEEKRAKFIELRDALKKHGHKIKGEELAVLAAFVNTDMPVEQIVEEVGDVDDALRHVTCYGSFAIGANLRRLFASALVLQVYDEKQKASSTTGGAVTESVVSTVVFNIIMTIIMIIIMECCVATTYSAS